MESTRRTFLTLTAAGLAAPALLKATPSFAKAPKQGKMKVSGPKFEVIADHSSDMSTGVSKRSAQKSSARKSKKLRELHAFWDNDFKRDSKSKALGNLKKLYGHEKIYAGDSLISM